MKDIAGRMREHFSSAFGLSDEAVEKLVETSRKSLGAGLGKLRRAVENSDASAVSHWAHSVKGNLLNAGLAELAAEAGWIEREATRGETGALLDRIRSLEEGLKAFLNGH